MKQTLSWVGSRWSGRGRLVAAIAVALVGVGIAEAAPPTSAAPTSAMDFLQKDGRFTFFVRLLNQSRTSSWLQYSASPDSTIFAPTDDAFTHLPQSVIEDLQKSPETLKWAIRYHIVNTRLTPTSLRLGPKALTGETLNLTGGAPSRTAKILESHSAGDMIVDVVDEVLISPEALKMLRRDGAVPIAVGLAISPPMTRGGVNQCDPTAASAAPVVQQTVVYTSDYPQDPYAYYYYGPELYYLMNGQPRRNDTSNTQRQPPRTQPTTPPQKTPSQPTPPPGKPPVGSGGTGGTGSQNPHTP